MRMASYSYYHSFNSRTPKGCDGIPKGFSLKISVVSIHAPLKGATEANRSYLEGTTRFNSRTPKGCDPMATNVVPSAKEFQFTHP